MFLEAVYFCGFDGLAEADSCKTKQNLKLSDKRKIRKFFLKRKKHLCFQWTEETQSSLIKIFFRKTEIRKFVFKTSSNFYQGI